MTDDDPKVVASRCLAAWSSGDLATTRALLCDDVVFSGPLGTTEGADHYIEGIRRMVESIERADQRQVFAEGQNVCIVYDLICRTGAATIPTAGWYTVRDGRVASVRAFFDPRPLLARSG